MGDRTNIRVGAGLPGLLKDGYKHFSGTEEAVMRNIEATRQLAQITRTSMGPNGAAARLARPARPPRATGTSSYVHARRCMAGMNKLVVNHLDKIFVTSDTGTIVKEMEIQHPAAKMVVMAATMQESEVRRRRCEPGGRGRGVAPVPV